MTKDNPTIRLHRFHGKIGLDITGLESSESSESSEQLYLTPENALAVARELTAFSNNIKKDDKYKWLTTRIVRDGKARTLTTGKAKRTYTY